MSHLSSFPLRQRYVVSALCLALLCCTSLNASETISEGCLQVYHQGRSLGYSPLKHTEVAVDISGFLARVTVVQEFTNPWPKNTGTIEAVYTFPLSERAAVDRMTMQIGKRTIQGVVKEREAARQAYERAKARGQMASLLDQERPNIFTQSVANIKPGQNVKITLSYVEYLPYEKGEYTFSFPMVIGPRYTPDGRQVPDAAKVTPSVTASGKRAGHTIGLTVQLDAGVPIRKVDSVLHAVTIEKPLPGKARISLKKQQEIPNRDFILKYRVAAKQLQDSIMTYHDERGGFFSLVLLPPEKVEPVDARPKEMIFVIDSSGSMGGFPIEKAKATMRRCIEQMNPRDTFNLISFAGSTSYCFHKSVANTRANRNKALTYLRNLQAGGGTELMKAIQAALHGPYSDERLRIVCFMTDGFISNEMAILDEIQKRKQHIRVFTFGIGNSVNRFLVEDMAREGRGAAEIVTLESDADQAVERFHQRIQHPVLTEITLDFGDLHVKEVYPKLKELPDLFSKQPLVITGRYTKAGKGAVTLRGKTGKGAYKKEIKVHFPANAPDHDVLASLWARTKIDTLMARDWRGMQQHDPKGNLKKKITKLGVDYQLMTQFTSFVAVEKKKVTKNGVTRRVDVPIEMPDGVSFEDDVFVDVDWLESSLGTKSSASGGGGGSRRGGGGSRGGSTHHIRYAPPVASSSAPTRGRSSSGAVTGQMMPQVSPKPPASKQLIVAEPVAESVPHAKDLKQSVRMEEEAADSAVSANKLDPALRGLAGKVVNGQYRSAKVRVERGQVKVLVYLSDMNQQHLDALRAFGVKIISESHAGQKLLVKVPVKKLDALAKQFTFITKIMPTDL